MRETTDTNPNYPDETLPDGRNIFRVESVKRMEKGKTVFYIWSLSYKANNQEWEGTQVFLPSMMGGLLKVLGATEVKTGVYEWDTDLMEGKQFEATVSHAPDKKDPSKIRQHMSEFAEEDLPF